MTNEELKKILENHQHWLNEDVDGWREMRADFTGAHLEGANLTRADFTRADFTGANLEGANLSRADFTRVDFTGANLEGANLSMANLEGANLACANLEGANLEGANLSMAKLVGANLEGANLKGVELEHAYVIDADLRGANLKGVELEHAYVIDADLRGAKNVPFMPMACPDEGAFIGWKKALVIGCELCIIKLYIPADAKRSSAMGRKCRCNKAKVLSITHMLSGKSYTVANSSYDKHFIYKVGEYVEVDNFDEDRFNECAPGIHFFINKQEAMDY